LSQNALANGANTVNLLSITPPILFPWNTYFRVRKGEKDTLDNLAYSCQGCNNAKHTAIRGLDTVTGQIEPLHHPRLQPWSEHFQWTNDLTQVISLTSTGRATFTRLRLNRKGVINLRFALAQIGEHPALK